MGSKIIVFFLIVGALLSFIDFIESFIKHGQHQNNIERNKAEELSKAFEIERSLNGVLNNQRAEINRLKQQILNNSEQDKHMKNNDKQTVYKIEKGDLVGDIKGDNITVILMNGDVNGDISSKEGDVVLIKGDINGDIKANKVICPQQKSEYENYIDKPSSVEKLSKPDKDNKLDKEKMFRRLPLDLPPDYVRCADCAYAEDYSSNMYRCSKYDGAVTKDSVRMCDYFKEKEDLLMHDKKCINCRYCHMSESHGLYCVINGMYTWIDNINGCGFYEEKKENKIVKIVVQCILLIPTIATIGGFWYMFFALIINGTIPKRPSDREIEEKTK